MSLSVAAGNESRSANSFWDNVSDKVKQADKKALDEEMKYVGSQTSITDPTASKASESEASEESDDDAPQNREPRRVSFDPNVSKYTQASYPESVATKH
jgi:hypothetical protein